LTPVHEGIRRQSKSDPHKLIQAEGDPHAEPGSRRQAQGAEDHDLATLLHPDGARHQEGGRLDQKGQRFDGEARGNPRRQPKPAEQEVNLQHGDQQTGDVATNGENEIERPVDVEIPHAVVEEMRGMLDCVAPVCGQPESLRDVCGGGEEPPTLQPEKTSDADDGQGQRRHKPVAQPLRQRKGLKGEEDAGARKHRLRDTEGHLASDD